MTSRSQRESRIKYTPKKRTSPILEKAGDPGGPHTPGAKSKKAKAKRAAKKSKTKAAANTSKPY